MKVKYGAKAERFTSRYSTPKEASTKLNTLVTQRQYKSKHGGGVRAYSRYRHAKDILLLVDLLS